MDKSRYELEPGLWLDARRAIWLERERLLAVADLHLGYAWAHRHGGQMLPITIPDDTTDRLHDLQRSYQPREIILLGDIVHRAVPVVELKKQLGTLIEQLSRKSKLTLISGNHDRRLEETLAELRTGLSLVKQFDADGFLFVHGDGQPPLSERSKRTTTNSRRIIIGHEHPAITLGDGVASHAKCACFLVGPRVIVLPAFSRWAAGTSFGSYPFSSPIAQQASFELAVAILNDKLLPVRLDC